MKPLVILAVLFMCLAVSKAQAQSADHACKTHRTAPPVSAYAWPPDARVKVFFDRGMFTAEQRQILFNVMVEWTHVSTRAGAGVVFVDAGEVDGKAYCIPCLTVTRREVHKNDRKSYAWFVPLRRDSRGALQTAWIDLDFATQSPKAVQGYMAHEMGHGMGLWDCPKCKRKQTIMSSFPSINRDNGLTAPSDCDLQVVRQVYQQSRHIARNDGVGMAQVKR